jgi:hypothetical protein
MPYYFIEDLFIGGWMADRCNVPRFNVTKGVIAIKTMSSSLTKGAKLECLSLATLSSLV